MAADSNMGFHHDAILASALNRHAISFQSGAINSSSGMIPIGNPAGVNSTAGMFIAGNSSVMNGNNTGMSCSGNSSGSSHLFESGLKHDAGFAIDWSVEEQSRLEEGLIKYANEPNIMRYIKIAATLRDKTVRDVALRCRWMMNENRKRRKQEHYNGRKLKDKKDILAESSKANARSLPLVNVASNSLMVQHMDSNDRLPFEGASSTTWHLLEENKKAFNQIAANLTSFRVQENIDLLYHTRNNIFALLDDMRSTPGLMREMPPLPVSINDELANTILPSTSQGMMFGSPQGIHLKQEPRC
ncbi:hypothetical protein Scep_016014 [Stephania cephalantha]|uniref:Uncharacterized protein n=1 Tax=Stephania cephalantha TaxID=152367 RepID=A0AAP0ILT0_9MAGN